MYLTAETRTFIREHLRDDVYALSLQAAKYPGVDVPTAIVQISGRQAIEHKIPSWYAVDGILYPPHLPLEQCSSEVTALYKAGLLRGETLVDLTGGFGVDCAFLSPGFRQVTYIERQKELCDIAARNFSLLELTRIAVQNRDSVEALEAMSPVDCIFIDPARRNRQGGKTVLVSDCEPDVEALQALLLRKAKRVLVKLSPMLDLSLAVRSLSRTCEIHVVSVQNECKELLLALEAGEPPAEIPVHCVNFSGGEEQTFRFTLAGEKNAAVVYTNRLRGYLYEPNASILKAGAFRIVAARYHLEKLHPNSHLYTSDALVERFPGRVFRVENVSGSRKDILRGVEKAHIAVRNFPVSAADLRKHAKLADGGDIYLFATTLADGEKIFIRSTKAV